MPKQVKNTAEIGKQGGRSNLGCLAAAWSHPHSTSTSFFSTALVISSLLLRITGKGLQTLVHLLKMIILEYKVTSEKK